MGTGRVLRCSSGPEPFPGIPIKEPLQPQEPGEVLIRYELEAAPQLNRLGWCCFGTLCCVALPLSWLPFVCDFCKQQYQRPVYGYPMDCLTVSFIAAAEDAWSTHKASTDAPAIHCMDATLVEPLAAVQQDQQQQQQWQHKPDTPAQLRVRCTPSPPPMSIFIPPSAVPACGFTAHNPFPSRYSEYSPAASTGSPVHRGFGMPQAMQVSSPRPSAGLPMIGMVNQADLELQHRRQLELVEMQAQAQAQTQAQAQAVAQAQVQVQTVA